MKWRISINYPQHWLPFYPKRRSKRASNETDRISPRDAVRAVYGIRLGAGLSADLPGLGDGSHLLQRTQVVVLDPYLGDLAVLKVE